MDTNLTGRMDTSGSATRPGRWRLIAIGGITLACAAAALALGQKIWTLPPGAAAPPGNLLPLFIALEAITDIFFGLGVSFVVFGYPLLARAHQPLWLTYATYVSIAWLMLNWWPHGNLHRVTPAGAWGRLLFIDYGFHVSLMVAVGVVALFFLRTLRADQGS